MDYEYLRPLLAFCCGYILSVSGSLIQQTTQNTLAGPSTLGMNSLVVVVILVDTLLADWLGWSESYLRALAFFAFLWCGLAFRFLKAKAFSSSLASHFEGRVRTAILLGLCFNLFVGALFSILHFFFMAQGKPFPTELWFGNFRQVGNLQLMVVVPLSLIIAFFSARLGWPLRAMAFGVETSMTLKVPVQKVAVKASLLALASVGLATCFFGVFAFLGLIVPHLLRQFEWFKRDSSRELTWGGAVSGLGLMLLDQLCYHFSFQGTEIPVGLVSSVLGSLLLVILIIKNEWRTSR